MRFVIAAAAAALVGAAAAPALAQSDAPLGLYGNLGGTLNDAQGTTTKSITGRVGGRLHRYFGAEGEFTLGLSGDDRAFAQGTPAERELDVKQKYAGAAYAVGFLPITPNIDLLARVGYGASKYRIGPAGLAGYKVNEHGLRYGVGAQAFFDQSNGVRFDYTRVNQNNFTDTGGFFSAEDTANVWSLSYVRKF